MKNRIIKNRGIILLNILLIIVLINVFSANAANETGYININLEYKAGSNYDTDNDGVETTLGIIDFTVENTLFDILIFEATADGNLCTVWEIYSIENEESTKVCYGNENCCNFISLIPTRSSWKEDFYLSYGLYGASYNNVVSAKVIHVDYNLSLENPYSEIYYSEWASLDAVFTEENDSYEININSPDNSTILASGENIYLNFTTNISVSANYSFDNWPYINLGIGTSFYDLLGGILEYYVLRNNQHNLIINAEDEFGNAKTVNHTFIVNDTKAPGISINMTNNSGVAATYLELPLKVTSDEYASIIYKINNNDFSDEIDLGEDKTETIELQTQNGQNTLIINAADFNDNSKQYYFTFNFVELGTCSDAKQNGYETGIDCGGSCNACITFNVTTDRPSYNLTDQVYVTTVSRANSIVNLTVYRESELTYQHVFTPVFVGAPIGEIKQIENTDNAGNYIIYAVMHYLNIIEEKILSFNVMPPLTSPISVTINANATTINENDAVLFDSSVSGNSGSVSYKWDFGNDGSIDSTSKNLTRTYSTNGTYVVNLTVSDNTWSQSDIETITVRNLYDVTFFVRDNSTMSAIQYADIEINDIKKNTSSDGKVTFTIPEGEHNVKVDKSGYKAYSKKIEVEGNFEVLINLTEIDETPPIIRLVSPINNDVVGSEDVNFRYVATDKSDMTCRLYYGFYGSTLSGIKAVNNSIKSDIESEFKVNNLANGTYQWKIDCIDRNGNINSSEIWDFTLSEDAVINELSVDLEDQDKSTEDIVAQINNVIESLDGLSTKEKEAADAMQLRKKLEKAITEINRANRDLHSLIWRKLNETGLEEETNKILDSIENVKKTTPKSFEVIESTEFVKYPNKEDIKEAALIQLNQTNLKLSKKGLDKLVDKNDELQSLITVTTKVRIISFEYLDGNKETITLIQKTVITTNNLSDAIFYEVIPKDIANNIDQIEFLFDYEIVEEDPIIEIDISKIKDYAYFIGNRISLVEAENTKSILLSKDMKAEDKGLITGFAIFDNLKSKIVEEGDKRLIIEIIIIIVLAAIYLTYSFGGVEHIKVMLDGREINEVRELINLALEDIKNNDYAKSSSKYKEINSKFSKLEKEKRVKIKSSIIDLANKVNLLYVNKLVQEAQDKLMTDKKSSFSNYKKIQSLYKIFPKEYKSEVSKKCLELHNKLSAS